MAEEVEVVRVAQRGDGYGEFLSGAVGRGIVQVWTAAEMGGMKWRVLRLSYKTYGGAGLPYERAVTDVWSRGMFGGGCGWPSAVAMHQGRLWLAGTAANPQTVWGSVVDDLPISRLGTAMRMRFR